jgi:hypothetical protein
MPRRAEKKSESTRRQSKKQTTVGKPSSSRGTQSETFESKPRRATAVKAQAGITRKSSGGRGVIKRVVSTVLGALTRRKSKVTLEEPANSIPAKAARLARRTPDIPMDQIASTYTPTQTSLKGPFRTSGADRQRDQDFAQGAADERWNDEDRLTNKSGDPRIGTHGRTYEPGEKRAAKSRNEDE